MTDRINPYRLFYGATVPNWLMEQPNVSANAKLCYARLAQFAGKNDDGVAWPTVAELSMALAQNDRTVQRSLAELQRLRLIEAERYDATRPNRYYFLDHPWIRRRGGDKSVTRGGDTSDTGVVTDLSSPTVLSLESPNSESPRPASSQPPVEKMALTEARGIVEEWWEAQAIKPTSIGQATLAKRVKRLYDAGWPETLITEALNLAENFTEAALEGRLRHLRTRDQGRATAAAGGGTQRVTVAVSEGPGYVLSSPHPRSCACGGSGWLPAGESSSDVVPCDQPI